MFSASVRAMIVAALLGMVVGGAAVYAAAAAGRLVIGLKEPATPAIVRQVARDTQSEIVQISPTGTYLLVLPKKKRTPAEIKASSDKIAYVEPEVAMNMADEREMLLIMPVTREAAKRLIPAPRKAVTKGSKK